MEMMKKEKIKKKHDHYLHTIEVIYPIVNYNKMIESWTKTVGECKKWLVNLEDYKKDATDTAIKGFEKAFEEQKANIEKVQAMSDDEKLKYWKENFKLEEEDLVRVIEKKNKLIKETVEMAMKELKRYESAHKEELKNKQEALKKWNK